LRALEILHVLRPAFAPIVIIREMQALRSLGPRGQTLYASLLTACSLYKNYPSTVPIILETSEAQWISHEPRFQSGGDTSSFFAIEVGMMDRAEVHAAVVTAWQLVSEDGFQAMWNATGGLGSLFASILKDMQVDNVKNATAADLHNTIAHYRGREVRYNFASLPSVNEAMFRAVYELLHRLSQTADWRLPYGDRATEWLIQRHLLHVIYGGPSWPWVTPSTSIIRECMEYWLHRHRVEELGWIGRVRQALLLN
jgi:hypothetical protein